MKTLLSILCVFVGLGNGSAQAAEVLSSGRVAIGFNSDGSLVTDDRSLGMVFDPSGGANGAPMGVDMILPGYPFETFTLDWSGGHQTNGGPHLNGGVNLSWNEVFDTGVVNGVSATGTFGPVDFVLTYDLPWDLDILWIELTVTARSDVSDLWLARSVDPDPDVSFNSYQSINEAEDHIVTSQARYAEKAIALGVEGGTAGVCSNWCTRPGDILDGAGRSETADRVIGVATEVGSLSKGESRTVLFTYAFGVDADEARELARWGLEDPDRDGDGLTPAEGDCDDRDPWVGPDATEWPDGIDNDCDGQVDEGTSIFDDDGDGYTEEDGDCDDENPAVYPGAEPVEDIPDADCDGEADDGGWSREENQPEGWGVDPAPPVELVGGGCNTVGALTLTPWCGLLLLMGVRRRGGEA